MNVRAVGAEPLSLADLTQIGRRYDLARANAGSVSTEGPDWQDRFTADDLLETGGHLGMTTGPAAPAVVSSMERHVYTGEALFCATGPVILPVAPAGTLPRSVSARALLLRPGHVVVLLPGVWHAPCLGVHGATPYYWFAAVDDSVPTEWVDLDDGPIEVTQPEARAHVC